MKGVVNVVRKQKIYQQCAQVGLVLKHVSLLIKRQGRSVKMLKGYLSVYMQPITERNLTVV